VATHPQDVVRFGEQYVFPENDRYAEQTVTLTSTPGRSLAMEFGAVALVDPWWPDAELQVPVTGIGQETHPTALATVSGARHGNTELDRMAVAASVGHVTDAVTWQPLVEDDQHFHLDVDSALGAFYDTLNEALLQPLFEDGEHMKGVYDRALTELMVPMEVDGRVCVGYDKDMRGVAVLVDLQILTRGSRRVTADDRACKRVTLAAAASRPGPVRSAARG
jgi:hypothetical protein